MTLEDLKKIQPIPGFDCVKMKHDIQAEIYEETKGMTSEERREYFRKASEDFRREMMRRQEMKGDLVVREDPAEYDTEQR
jgi:hypothetical protein